MKYGIQKRFSKEYGTWVNMKTRCYNSNVKEFQYYGGRGITVCDQWKDNFLAFLRDMGIAPVSSRKCSIDRIDTNGNYEPSNCRWVLSQQIQSSGRRCVVRMSYMGKMLTLRQLALELGVTTSAVARRYYKGWTIERIIGQPFRKRRTNNLQSENTRR